MEKDGSWWDVCQRSDRSLTAGVNYEIFGEYPATQQTLYRFRDGHDLSLQKPHPFLPGNLELSSLRFMPESQNIKPDCPYFCPLFHQEV